MISRLPSLFVGLTCTTWILTSTPAFAQTTSAASSASAEPRSADVSGAREVAGPSVFPERTRPDPAIVPLRACSFRAPVCVHAAANVEEASIMHVLFSAEKFYRVTAALGLPQPLPDDRRGGDDRYDLYVLPEAAGGQTIADWTTSTPTWDRTSAFSIVPPPIAPFACDTEALIARMLARAAAWRVDAGLEDSTLSMMESYVADVATDCTMTSIAAVDDFQRFPERTLGFHLTDEASGAILFSRFLDDTYGAGVPGSVFFSLLSVAGQHRPTARGHYENEPDFFDALRNNSQGRGKPFDDLLLEFAVNRAFVGSRSDNGHLNDVDKYGDLGRVRFEWSVPYSTLPRRLAPMRPIEALGATYIWVDMQGAPEEPNLAFVADWEAGVLFHWLIVKVDARGIELGRISIAGIRGATHAERSLLELRGAAGLLIVGVNTGSIDRGLPFDPDEQELPRSYTVTVFH